jgi:SAM-dependent methyltransferase
VYLTEKYLAATPFYSAFWADRRLKSVIRQNAEWAHGTLLDVGCGLKPHEEAFSQYIDRYIGMDLAPESGYRGNRADMCGDAAQIPMKDGSVDTILCTEMLPNTQDPEQVISEFARILVPGGTLITTAAFVYPVHDRRDYFRFSPDGLASIMQRQGLSVEKVVPESGSAVTLSLLVNLYFYNCAFMWNKWLYPVGLLLRPLLWIACFTINVMGGVFEIILADDRLPIGCLTIATKKGNSKQKLPNAKLFSIQGGSG